MIVAYMFAFFLLLIFTYSVMFFEALGFQIMTLELIDEPHWLLQWTVTIWITVAMVISIGFLARRSLNLLQKFRM